MKSVRSVRSYSAMGAAGMAVVLLLLASVPLASAAEDRECFGRPVTLVGTSRSDELRGTSGADVIAGFAGNDVIRGLGGNDIVCGGPGHDQLYGGGAHDDLDGGRGSDVLSGASGNDVLSGASGSDWARGGGGNDSILGGAGLDTLDFERASRSIDANLARGSARGEGQDSLEDLEALFGSHLDDVLVGDRGANYLLGRFGDDQLDGGSGLDMVISYSDWSAEIDLASGFSRETPPYPSIPGSPQIDTLIDIESAMGGYFDDQISGDDGPNILIGLEGEDSLDGRGDADIFFTEGFGGPNDYGFSSPTGGDRVQGGPGAADLVDFSVVPGWIEANLADGSATANCSSPDDEEPDPLCGGVDALEGIEWLRGSERYYHEA
ncbi:MAG: calcium-binding protein, partial [Actinomycetota bacterium]